MDSITPESTMLQDTLTAFVPRTAPRAATRGRPLARRLAEWLVRCWQSQCRHAERPDRFVPYC